MQITCKYKYHPLWIAFSLFSLASKANLIWQIKTENYPVVRYNLFMHLSSSTNTLPSPTNHNTN